jgi:hypothetical protein
MKLENDKYKYKKAPFINESELENVVYKNYENFFGPSSIFLSKLPIKTGDGEVIIPNGFAIDIVSKIWYVIKAGLIRNDVFESIIINLWKIIFASKELSTKNILKDLALEVYLKDDQVKEKFFKLGIKEIYIYKLFSEILDKDPIIYIPIDSVKSDLKNFLSSFFYKTQVNVLAKYVELNDSEDIIYGFKEFSKTRLNSEKIIINNCEIFELNFPAGLRRIKKKITL